MREEIEFEQLAELEDEFDGLAPSRLKSRVYSRLILEIEKDGPLAGLSESKAAGWGICVHEQLIEILPKQQDLQSFQYCKVCHARVAGENWENAPIYWANCPYCAFQNR
ncbi:MAG: hypothetical protein FJW36_20395 [Acidobacteria bacterium]|nr:hypothetical protein [Acidobacteriota bacterium]